MGELGIELMKAEKSMAKSALTACILAFTGLALAAGIVLAQGDTSANKKELLQQKVAAIKQVTVKVQNVDYKKAGS
jgi:hypothetical protein